MLTTPHSPRRATVVGTFRRRVRFQPSCQPDVAATAQQGHTRGRAPTGAPFPPGDAVLVLGRCSVTPAFAPATWAVRRRGGRCPPAAARTARRPVVMSVALPCRAPAPPPRVRPTTPSRLPRPTQRGTREPALVSRGAVSVINHLGVRARSSPANRFRCPFATSPSGTCQPDAVRRGRLPAGLTAR